MTIKAVIPGALSPPGAEIFAAPYAPAGPIIAGTSTTSVVIDNTLAPVTFVMDQFRLGFQTGMRLRAIDTVDLVGFEGMCVSYNPLTNELVLQPDLFTGGGLYDDWTITVAGVPGIQGAEGPIGPQGPPGPSMGPEGPPGRDGPQGIPGDNGMLVGDFGRVADPSMLPISGFIPADFDGPGFPAAGWQLREGMCLMYIPDGHGWVYAGTVVSPATGWLDGGQIKGDKGDTGDPGGPIGPVGPEGPEGPEGPQGIPGPAGPIGPIGPAGPQTGVQSWNTRTGAVVLTAPDITGAGGALINSPQFTGLPTAPTPANNVLPTRLATTGYVNGFLPLAGGVVTGLVTMRYPASLAFDGAAADLRGMSWSTGGVLRWVMEVSGAETANQGARWSLHAYDDAGVILGTPLSIRRADGMVMINGHGAAVWPEGVSAEGSANLVLNTTSGAISANNIWGTRDGFYRWSLQLGSASPAETGGNSGSDFTLTRYADTSIGVILSTPLIIRRSDAWATFESGASFGGVLNILDHMTITPADGPNPNLFLRDTVGNRAILYFNAATGETTLLDIFSGSNIAMGPGPTLNLNAGTINATAGTFNADGNLAVGGTAGIRGGTLVITGTGGGNAQMFISDGIQNRSLFYFQGGAVGRTTMTDIVGNGSLAIDSGGTFYYDGTGVANKSGGGTLWNTAPLNARTINVRGDYTAGLAEVLKLRPITYSFRGNETLTPTLSRIGPDGVVTMPAGASAPYPASPSFHVATAGKTYAGLAPENLEDVFPDMVTRIAGFVDGQPANDLKTADQSELIYALVNAVKELAAKVEALEGQATARSARH